MQQKYTQLGTHILLELYGCPPALLEKPEDAQAFMLEAAARMQANIVSAHFHAFSPHGVSGVIIIQESHLTIHTWPEYGYAAIDVFTCGYLDVSAGIHYLIDAFEATASERKDIVRGQAPKTS